jgi:hypothetical protein
MTAGVVHVTNLTPGSECNPAARAGLEREPDALCTPLTVLALRGVALLRKCVAGEARAVAEEVLSRLERIGSWPSVHTFEANVSVMEVLCTLLSDAIFQGNTHTRRALTKALDRLVAVMKSYGKVFKLGWPRYLLAKGMSKHLSGDVKVRLYTLNPVNP